jgi:hypothetical protein
MITTGRPALPFCVVPMLASLSACDLGGVNAASSTAVDGDSVQNVELDDVAIDDLTVDADTNTDIDTNVDASAEGHVNIDVDADVQVDGDADGDVQGDTHAVANGFSFTVDYRGVVFEQARLAPSFSSDLSIASVEWLVRAPQFDEPTIVDDAAAFAWGAPDSVTEEGDEYLLGALFNGTPTDIEGAASDHSDVEQAFVWDTATRRCVADCAPRSISAVCKADIVLRVWLVDGTAIDAVADHISARVTCP